MSRSSQMRTKRILSSIRWTDSFSSSSVHLVFPFDLTRSFASSARCSSMYARKSVSTVRIRSGVINQPCRALSLITRLGKLATNLSREPAATLSRANKSQSSWAFSTNSEYCHCLHTSHGASWSGLPPTTKSSNVSKFVRAAISSLRLKA